MARQVLKYRMQSRDPLAKTRKRYRALTTRIAAQRASQQALSAYIAANLFSHQPRLHHHQILRGQFSTRQNRVHGAADPSGKLTGKRPGGHKRNNSKQPRQKAKQPQPPCLQCQFHIHAVRCLSLRINGKQIELKVNKCQASICKSKCVRPIHRHKAHCTTLSVLVIAAFKLRARIASKLTRTTTLAYCEN